MDKLKLTYGISVRLGLFGSTNELNEIPTIIYGLAFENRWEYIEYITGSLGNKACALTECNFESEKEYDRCIIFLDGSEECNKVIQHCKNNSIPYWTIKPNNSNFFREVVLEKYGRYKPLPDDYLICINETNSPITYAFYHGGEPITPGMYGRIDKYINRNESLGLLAIHLKRIDKRIVLLCRCEQQPCHCDYIREQLIKLGV